MESKTNYKAIMLDHAIYAALFFAWVVVISVIATQFDESYWFAFVAIWLVGSFTYPSIVRKLRGHNKS